MATIMIPTALRAFTDRQAEVTVSGATVGQILKSLGEKYPDLKPHLFDDRGELRSFINVFVGENNINNIGGMNLTIKEDETVSLIPAIAGGTI